MKSTKKLASNASIVSIEGRKVSIFVEDDENIDNRFSFVLNDEPTRFKISAIHKKRIAYGLNLISNGTFTDHDLPWRPIGNDKAVIGRNLSQQWNLSNGYTAYLSVPLNTSACAEYRSEPDDDAVPVIPNEPYSFLGYFACHRCDASARIDLLDSDRTTITSLHRQIPKMPGGTSIGDYAKLVIDFEVPAICFHVKIFLSVNNSEDLAENSDTRAYLFFTDISFTMSGECMSWRPQKQISAQQIAALSGNAAILDVTLPRFFSTPGGKSPTIDIIDKSTSTSIDNSPFLLPMPTSLAFRFISFDGVTLVGELKGIVEKAIIELTIDHIVTNCKILTVASEEKLESISFRVPDEFLDGCQHILELRDGTSGATLYINAVNLKSLTASWEQVDNLGRFSLPVELHPAARCRYTNLLAHMTSVGRPIQNKAASLDILAQCHEIVATKDKILEKVLNFPWHDEPVVSIILSTSDPISTYETIAALILAYNVTHYEVIVSTDGPLESVLAAKRLITGVEFISSEKPLRRAQLVNQGIRTARGEYVVLLDNSAEPHAFWIDELRNAYEIFEEVGIVGCKLVNVNGRLHEAGAILWSSGHRQPVGINGNAEHPQANYARQVDCVSSQALMIRKDILRAIDGVSDDLFDLVLEDIDLALKVRTAGYKVVYAPQATVMLNFDGKKASPKQISTTAFRNRWLSVLQDQMPEKTSTRYAMDHGIRGRILFIDQQVPRIDVDAGSYAAIQEIRIFQALGYKVTFLPLNLQYSEIYVKFLERIGAEVIYAPFALSVEDVVKERGDEFSLVYITRYHVARAVLPFIRRYNPKAKIIFNNADLHFLRELRSALALNDSKMLQQSKITREHELDVMRQTDLTLSYNEVEHAVIESHNLDQTKVAKAPWIVTPATSVPSYSNRADIGFLGSFGHRPNIDAVRFFVSDVLPLLRRSSPNIRLLIYGSQIGPEITALASDHVLIKGHASCLADAFDSIKVFVAPLTAGAGLKGKVLNAMAHGVPSILSPAAAEGISIQPEVHYLRAKAPSEWADAIQTLYNDEALWNQISQNSLDLVRINYSFEVGVNTMRKALEMINVFPPPKHNVLTCRLSLPPLV